MLLQDNLRTFPYLILVNQVFWLIISFPEKKIEGDKKTPIGTFEIEHLYYRKDRIKLPKTFLKTIEIKPNMGWSDDINFPNKYNKLIRVNKLIHHEKLFRNDNK